MTKKIAKPGEQYYGAPCKKCKEIFLLPHRYNPRKETISHIECDKCGHKETYLRKEIILYDVVQVH